MLSSINKKPQLLAGLCQIIESLPPSALLDFIVPLVIEQIGALFTIMGEAEMATDAYTIWTVCIRFSLADFLSHFAVGGRKKRP